MDSDWVFNLDCTQKPTQTSKYYDEKIIPKEFYENVIKRNKPGLFNDIKQNPRLVKEITADKTPEGISRLENLQELFNSIKDYTQTSIEEGKDPKISAFIEDIALLTDQDKNKGEEYDFVSLKYLKIPT